MSLFQFSSPFFCGLDAIGAGGRLLVFGWSSFDVECVYKSPNAILCYVLEPQANEISAIFFYGSPIVENRSLVWDELVSVLNYNQKCLILGDLNQVEHNSDKLGGSGVIRGWEAFTNWRIHANVLDVPFTGPRNTWSNKREGNRLILERLD